MRRYIQTKKTLLVCCVLAVPALPQTPLWADEGLSKTSSKPSVFTRLQSVCEQRLDTQALQQLQERGMALRQKVVQLCQQGERNRAQSQAIEFAMQLQKSAAVIGYRRCRDELTQPLPELDRVLQQFFISALRFTHSCELVQR